MTTGDILTIIGILILLGISGFFSGSETALTAASKARINRLAAEGNKAAIKVAKLIEDRERLIGGILLGNNLVNILAAALATGLFISLVGEEGIAIATVVMTLLILVFAEVLPKTYAISKPERMALGVAPIIDAFVKVLGPVVRLVQKIVNGTLKAFGVDTSEADHVLSGHDEIRGTLDIHLEEGRIYKAHKDMLGSILDLDEITLDEVMIHRKSMVTLNLDDEVSDLLEKATQLPFTRIPLWQRERENIVGVLHARDVMVALKKAEGDLSKIKIKKIMKTPWFVPETTTLREQLGAFQKRVSHFALVVDEYGVLLGLVTLEDILEEIVGDIRDEKDKIAPRIKRLKGGGIMVDGDMSIRDLNRKYSWNLPDDEAASIAGLIINEAQIIPFVGQKFDLFGLKFEIKARRKNQITRIKITKVKG
ncbi:MAG: HlyC/CorC family transporter [Sphingomonadales bacterium]